MKFFKIEKVTGDNINKIMYPTGELLNRVYPSLTALNIHSEELKNLFHTKQISPQKMIPSKYNEIRYFQGDNFSDIDKEDWIKLDIYYFSTKNISMHLLGYLISPELKKTMVRFLLGFEHRFVKAELRFQNKLYNYFYFQYLSHCTYEMMWEFERIKIYNKDEPQKLADIQIKEKYKLIHFSGMIGVDKKYDNWLCEITMPKYADMLLIPHFGQAVSERLKIAMETAGCLGVEFRELPHIRLKFDEGYPIEY